VIAFGVQPLLSFSWTPYDDSGRAEIASRHGWDYNGIGLFLHANNEQQSSKRASGHNSIGKNHHSLRPYNVIGYLDATTAPIRRRGVVAFSARRAKELGADAIVVLEEGQEYAGSISTGNAYTAGNFYPGGFNATTTGTGFSGPLFLGKAKVLAIKWR
jgi:hypothetical protein